jgi:hypothetical protein
MNYIYILIFYLYVEILYFLVLFLGGYYPLVFLPGRVWDKIYTHMRVWVWVVGKILGNRCGFGYALPAPNGGGCHRYPF